MNIVVTYRAISTNNTNNKVLFQTQYMVHSKTVIVKGYTLCILSRYESREKYSDTSIIDASCQD